MPLQEIEYEADSPKPPEPFAALIAEADRRWADFWADGGNRRYPRYVASEPTQVYAALKFVRDQELALGDSLLEWGSGFGVATCLAGLLGYEATGIELQPGLLEVAEALALSHRIDVRFVHGSYIPEGITEYETLGGSDILTPERTAPESSFTYPEMDIPLDEVDVFFVYPWPGEQEMMLRLFEAVSGDGAILIAYYGDREIALYRNHVADPGAAY